MLLPCITVSNNIVAKIINYFDFFKKENIPSLSKNIVAEHFVDLFFLSLNFLALNMRGSSGKAGIIENFILNNAFSFFVSRLDYRTGQVCFGELQVYLV